MLKCYDISQWQPVGSVDFSQVDAVIIKATEGVGYTDPLCDQHYQMAKAQGKLLGVYAFAHPGYNDPIAEADWFVSQIQGYIGEALLVLDWEVEATWNVDWAKRWLDRVYEKTGVKPLIYASGGVITGNNWSSVANSDYGLWIAYWPNVYQYGEGWPSSLDEMTYGTGDWPFWAIWQFSSRNGRLDCDVANMDREAWMRYAAKNGEPAPAPAPSPAPAPAPTPEPSKDYVEYTVVSGDTLSGIAAKYGTTYQKIAQDNGIANPNLIFPGQVLKIYGASGGGNTGGGEKTYTVKSGDTLSGIAAMYGTTYQKIAADNGIANPNLIYPGQVLVIK